MNKRLAAICRMIPEGRGVIDVGTDHAYLPVQLYKNGYQGNLFASDIREGPLRAARAAVEKADADAAVTLSLCDGLDACPPEKIDTIVIAGMGGDTICGILDRAEWCWQPEYLLLLQPMTKPEVLRYWLINNGFLLEQEDIVEDCGILYQIIAARFSGQNTVLLDAELFFGSYHGLRTNSLYPALVKDYSIRMRKKLSGMLKAARREDSSLRLLHSILKETTRIEELLHDDRQ